MNVACRFGWLARVSAGALLLGVTSPVALADVDCLADFNRDGVVDSTDLADYLSAWLANDPAADYVPDGVIDTQDVVAFLNYFAAGCTGSADAGEPNPNDPGEQGFAVPGGGTTCVPFSTMSSLVPRWVDSVYPFSGEVHQEVVDLAVPGRAADFAWVRRYRSQAGPNTAQGNRWDFSYNIFLEQYGPHLNLHDGFARTDTYAVDGVGRWTRAEFFRTLVRNPDGTYTLTFANAGTWNFHALDGSAQAGKIESIIDRNQNAITFEYDVAGRLAVVTDDLGRDYSVSYNAQGMITSVCDFAGRCVKYKYYENGDPNGSAGDLRAVSTPAVTGTPTGNNFPAGQVTRYTYTRGSLDDRLNHLITSITDAKGQTSLRVTYGRDCDQVPNPTTNVLTCARVTRQQWGAAGDFVDLTYFRVAPTPSNNFAVLMVTLNDREGHVKELYYDAKSRGVMLRELTGLANPDRPTTPYANRPTGKLRPTDPASFDTRWNYNADGLVTEFVHPNLNSTVQIYDEGNVNPRARGNMLERHYLPGPLGGDQKQRVETFEYNDTFGGCGCGPQFATRHVDARGNVTLNVYDDRGNRVRTIHPIPSIVEDMEYNAFGQLTAHVLPDNGSGHRRRDEFTYYKSGIQSGRMHRSIVDAGGLALTTTFVYDAVGNVITEISPGGHETQTVYNQLNQPVRTISPEVTPGGVRYQRDTYYDANKNIVRVDVQNRDDQGTLRPNAHYTTVYEYDSLNRLVRECAEAGEYTGAIPGPPELPTSVGLPDAHFVRREYAYDANGNRTLVRFGEAVEGRQPDNRVTTVFDERDLAFRVVRAPGHPSQSTTQSDYDANGNLITTTQGLESASDPKYPGDAPRITRTTYDGYNRPVTATDAMGNVTQSAYDPNGNLVATTIQGQLLDVEGSVGNVRLGQAALTYDPMNRLVRTDTAFFDTTTQAPILAGATPDGFVTTQTQWTGTSQVRLVRDDNLHETLTQYDTANRVASITDPKDNRVEYTYDSDSRVIQTLDTDLSDLGRPAEHYLTVATFDGLDRQTSSEDNVGNVTTMSYDSRSNRTRTIDARGVETRRVFDGLGRLTAVIRDLDADGADGDGPDITTTQGWDDTSRLVGQGDDNANVTVSVYDPLDRRVSEEYADCTATAFLYDTHDNAFRTTDANGSVIASTFDLLDRRSRADITPGAGVSADTTLEQYAFDGLSRQVLAQDNDSRVVRSHDSLSHITREVLTVDRGPAETLGTTTCGYDGVGNQLSCVYPSGRAVTTVYDALDRKSTIADQAGTIADYDYIGRRVERREYGNGTRTDYTYDGLANDPGDFGVRRIVRTRHTRIADGTLVDDRTFAWDQVQNKTKRADVRAGGAGLTHVYTYDDALRLTHTTVTNAGGTVICNRDYDLDGVGNREAVAGCSDAGAYTMASTLCAPGDLQMNQYTTTPFDTRTYDANGNLVTINAGQPGERQFSYDARNRMVELRDLGAGRRHLYRYDPSGRRIRRVVNADGAGGPPVETRYFYHAWQVIEDQSSAGAPLATYAYGSYVDDVLNMRRPGTDLYYHADDLANVMALTNAAGAVAERYEFLDFGQPADPATGAAIVGFASPLQNRYLFSGREFDSESNWYCFRTRYQDPRSGRFTTRDTLGIWADAAAAGSPFVYVANRPLSATDPFGEWLEPGFIGCTMDDRQNIRGAFSEAQRIAGQAVSHMGAVSSSQRSCDRRYKEWFGSHTSNRWGNVHFNFILIHSNIAGRQWVIGCRKDKSWYGRTLWGSSYIELGSAYFGITSANGNTSNSRAGVLVHEVSHSVAQTWDIKYGETDARNLASNHPMQAVLNADNYEYFAENVAGYTPGQGCSSSGGGGSVGVTHVLAPIALLAIYAAGTRRRRSAA